MPDLGDLSALTDRSFAAVIFDNDGTLVDSTPAVRRSWSRWAREHDVQPELLVDRHGTPAAEIIAAVAPHVDPAAALQRIVHLETTDLDGVIPLPGAVEAVRALGRRYAAIATSATRELGAARLDAAGIPKLDVVITYDDVKRGKPAPDPFLLAATRLGVEASECLVVEDANAGLAGARAAGCATLAVTTTLPAAELTADAIVTSLDDVRFALEGERVRVTSASASPGSTNS